MSKSESKEEILVKSIRVGKGVKKMSKDEISNFLKKNIIDLNILDNHGYNILHHAIKSQNTDLVYLLLHLDPEHFITEKANPNTLTSDDSKQIYLSPIHFALQACDDSGISSKIIKILISAGADINSKDEEGCSIYLKACEKGRLDLLDYLLNNESINFNINEISQSGSGLHMAIIGDKEDVVAYLLDRNIDVSLKDSNGNTAIHLALQLKMNNSFKMIVDHITNNKEFSDEYKKTLLNSHNEEGNTILHELAYARCGFLIEMIKKLPQEISLDQEKENKDGYTYKGVQENIVKLQKDKEAKEKAMREEIRKEKERIAQKKKEEIERLKEEQIKYEEEEEKRRQFGLSLIKYRGYIFVIIFFFLMFILYVVVNTAVHKKKEKII
jgi:ankyrin repeat protein